MIVASQLDIVIPVYNEGQNILSTLAALKREVKTPARVLICYDMPDDDTPPAVRNSPDVYAISSHGTKHAATDTRMAFHILSY